MDRLEPLNANASVVPAGFWDALQKSWSVDSCWGPLRDAYMANDGANPSLGNCLVSVFALWAQTGFKGIIVPDLTMGPGKEPGKDKPAWHFHIKLGGVPIDLTRQQFKKGTVVTELEPDRPPNNPMYRNVIIGSIFNGTENASLRKRLHVLLNNMSENGYPVIDDEGKALSANYIVDRAECEFARFDSIIHGGNSAKRGA